ncbi:MAG: GTP-binding protein [Geminocystis sp.]|nr:GTP-binding protein [Geminocystis sp.]HIK36534.1 DUF697 domain-containing protein [Geminocystis sp. M7585_C2015_104]MCS7148178.1 GTP-binding protein [Geminocystis sp.]MCX8077591.1 GTP-binding protein [Geminocystis sp.]MDW8117257.1 GTP-binding protein [Geminocystis sp.]
MTPHSYNFYELAKTALQKSLTWYCGKRRYWNYPPNPQLQAIVQEDLKLLQAAYEKLQQPLVRIAAFGLVNRGKSSILNALVGENIFTTGPTNGVTQWPTSVTWTPPSGKPKIELIDTPGLDEIDGETRAQMAKQIGQQADLILFVIAGDITRTEYLTLCQLRQALKPLILVFNKIDLFPATDIQLIYKKLQELSDATGKPFFLPDDIVFVSAQPKPVLVRVELPNGEIKEDWETPPPLIQPLQEKILSLLQREGKTLLALNALQTARRAQKNIAHKTVVFKQEEAEELIWRYARYKALIVAINPIIFLDLVAGFFSDLLMVRDLARLYGLPITSYEAGVLWNAIVKSLGGLFVTDFISSLALGWTKTTAAISSLWENPSSFTTYAAAAAAQAVVAGYNSYLVGKAAQVYLENGCTWGDYGIDTIIAEIIVQSPPQSIIARLHAPSAKAS